jgi:hypothetical protein
VTAGKRQDLLGRVLPAQQDVGGSRLLGQLQALGDEIHAYDLGPARGGEHDRTQPHRPEADDEDPVAARDVGAQDALVGGAEPAGHQGAVGVGQLFGQVEQGAGLGEEKVGVAPVALPAVGRPPGRVAPDHEPLAALLAVPAAYDVVGDDPVAGSKPTTPGPTASTRPAGSWPAITFW